MPLAPSYILAFTFIALIVSTTLIRVWLGRRHISYVQTHRNEVPSAFKDSIALDAHQKAADYSSAKTKLIIIEVLAQAVLLLALTLGGGLQFIDDIWRNLLVTQEIIRGALVICSALLVSSFIDLPFEYYKTFAIDEKFGFNKMTPAMFFSDLVKHSLVGIALGAPILFAALWLMQEAGEYWWLYLWLTWSAFNLVMLAVYPTFIAPLFNKFAPLKDEALKQRIEALLTKCGFKSQGLFVMDGSSRSSHGNAYFTGFGASKRVVFFDTLLERLNADEIEAVLAHELGHFKHHHVIKRIALMFFVISTFWMFLPSTDIFKKGLYFTLAGFVLALILLFV